MPLRIGVVVGEISGDNLAADLIASIKKQEPDLIVEGVLGPKLIAQSGRSLYPMERLSVMGLIEPLARLPELWRMRRHLVRYFSANPPDFFIGVDAPDFNLGLEHKLKRHGIPIVHYVSPSVWAWRQSRIHLIRKSVDLMLTLLPFEAQFYHEHQVPVCFVGHPLADKIPLSIDTQAAKQKLGLTDDPVVVLMPGSRRNELKRLGALYLKTAKLCLKQIPTLQFLVPLASKEHEKFFKELCRQVAPKLPIKTLVGNVHSAVSAATVVLVTSGTATLEVMLHKKPMVVAYQMHPLTYWIAKRLVKVPYIALPNLLANESLVPEYIQAAATPKVLAKDLLERLSAEFNVVNLQERFLQLHQELRQNGSNKAASLLLQKFQKIS